MDEARVDGQGRGFSRISASRRGGFRCPQWLTGLVVAWALCVPGQAFGQNTEHVLDPGLGAVLERFETPQLMTITDRVSLAFAFDLANVVVIEGDDGVILIDTGWKVELAQEIRAAIAEKTEKANIWSVNTEAEYHEEK